MKKLASLKLESVFYWVLIFFNISFIFETKFIPTLDSPSHLINSQLIISLLENDSLSQYFKFNEALVPNWIGHFILSSLNYFFPAFVADKVLLLIYFIGFPLVFRALIKTIAKENLFLSYFSFPFSFSFAFSYGFYNFLLSLVLLLFILNYWIKNEEKNLTLKQSFFLFFLFVLMYFSHLFVFGILLILIALRVVYNFLNQVFDKKNDQKTVILNFSKKIIQLLLILAAPLFLSWVHFSSNSNEIGPIYLNIDQLLLLIDEFNPFACFNKNEILSQILILFYTLCFLIVTVVFSGLNKLFSKHETQLHKWPIFKNYWFLAVLLIFLLFFLLPNETGSAGYISERLAILIYFFTVFLLANFSFNKWISISVIALIVYANIGIINYYKSVEKNLNKWATECNNFSELIAENSLVLTINNSDLWIINHFPDYLGIDKPMVILNNYECSVGYFPLIWNKNSFPNALFGDLTSDDFSCIGWEKNLRNEKKKIDYVFVLDFENKHSKNCDTLIQQKLDDYYQLLHQSEHFQLYELKNQN